MDLSKKHGKYDVYSEFYILVCDYDGAAQGCNARKVNCGRVYSAYTLKPFSLGGICKQE